jgi:hypothetical protein
VSRTSSVSPRPWLPKDIPSQPIAIAGDITDAAAIADVAAASTAALGMH